MQLADEKFFSLEGKWRLKRSIPGFGEMKGLASFSLLPQFPCTFFYREEGIFKTSASLSLPFYREYMYCLRDGKIDVYFASGGKKEGLFLSLSSSQDNGYLATGVHQCGEDTYLATYRFLTHNTFFLRCDVKGPQKDFSIHTCFERNLRDSRILRA